MAEVSVKLVLDTKKQLSSRLFFLDREDDYEWTQNFVLTKEVPFCKTYDVYLIVSLSTLLIELKMMMLIYVFTESISVVCSKS